MKPLVSIIIPVYNGENFLKEAVESALNQTYKNIEIIVINDGSTDNTESIALSFGDKIKYYKKSNGGVSSALNLGIEKMSGEYFSWLSHDDLYDENKIQNQITELSKWDYAENVIAYSSAHLINSEGKIIKYGKIREKCKISGYEVFDLLINKNLNGCGLLIPKVQLVKIKGFDTKFKYLQDLYSWIKMSLNDIVLVRTGEILVYTRIHRNQQTVKISHLLKLERAELINYLISLDGLQVSQKKSIIDFSIKNGFWRNIKDYYRENRTNFPFKYRITLVIKIIKSHLILYGKKIYWKLKRR